MQVLLQILVALCDFFCQLCPLREKAQARLDLERSISKLNKLGKADRK